MIDPGEIHVWRQDLDVPTQLLVVAHKLQVLAENLHTLRRHVIHRRPACPGMR